MSKKIFILLLVLSAFACNQKQKNTKIKPVKETLQIEGKTAVIITTAKDTNLRLTKTDEVKFSKANQPTETANSVFVNPNHSFQTFIGIGGAITDASAEVFAKLSKEKQQELLSAYYGKDGIDYTLMRTSIHSCDFSSESYTYIEEGDKELKTFSIEHDRQYRIPMIKQAIKKAGGKMLFYMSPWSPPAFMKGKKDMLGGGKLLPEFNKAWAKYYAKTIQAYEKEGIPVWGITIQNEPMATQRWESCIYTAEEERDFLKNYLGPTFEKEGLGDKNIVVWDHNRDLLSYRASTIFDDPEASKYAWGIGFHWYENWRGGEPNFNALQTVQEAYPDKKLLFTEGCNEAFDAAKYQYWPNAERYGKSMINDFNRGTVGWTDWNILLDETGGPNHVQNLCFAPIHADTSSDKIIYTPSYYYIGHFSKYIRPNAKRLSTTSSISFLESTSFKNEDGKIVTVVMNTTNKDISYNLYVGTTMAIPVNIPARAMQSIIY
ncbi:glycoside hydrolase family 30 protein [Lutibacter sp. TH_r2]|uniref:glycoside hydrolase family 30 protein n=1 Tax=Lutibacter sp. TH_r2 TaxID=3082083 RepID=UPI00295319DF|nr:glycoside hydrolase family 30 protein [Lutibacter sp. TH_r2]MDV7186142.1 glycoside hydrolase family 30 protein [Lutibacter sp. TH_r2]